MCVVCGCVGGVGGVGGVRVCECGCVGGVGVCVCVYVSVFVYVKCLRCDLLRRLISSLFRFQSFSWRLPIRAILIRAKNAYQIFRRFSADFPRSMRKLTTMLRKCMNIKH